MTARRPALVAVDGVAGAAIAAAARTALASIDRARRSGISYWDASGLFDELAVADEEAGRPSARTLLLLYAADLAFRLRWEIRPALAEGRCVVAAPYVDTAIALGRAAGLSGVWLTNLFLFAPRPNERRFVEGAEARSGRGSGFVEFACDRLAGPLNGATRTDLVDRMAAHLRAAARRRASVAGGRRPSS
jgi:hypothetical protein